MKSKHSKKLIAKILLFSICFPLLLAFSPLQAKKAEAWDAAFGAVVDNIIGALREQILGIIMGALKQAAVEMVMKEISKMISDSENGDKFIRDWEDYVKTQPEKKTKKIMNDYISSITQGRGSSRYSNADFGQFMGYAKNYEGVGGMNEYQFALIQSAKAQSTSGGDNTSGERYSETLKNMNDQITASDDEKKPEITCTDEERNNMFSGDFGAFWKCTEGINYAPSAYVIIDEKNQEVLTNEQAKQNLKALSSGYLPSEQNGKVSTPAGTNEAVENKAATLSMDTIPNAKNIGEVLASAAVTMLMKKFTEGIDSNSSQRQDNNTEQRSSNNTQNQVQQSGPQAMFKGN